MPTAYGGTSVFGHRSDSTAIGCAWCVSVLIAARGFRATDFVARYGGEEFVLVLPNTDGPGAIILADRMRANIEAFPFANRAVTASFGIGSFRGDMKTRAELTAGTDAALYASKEAGRNRVTHVSDLTGGVSETNL